MSSRGAVVVVIVW